MSILQVGDIQGIIVHGYGRLESACFLLLSSAKPAAMKTWLNALEVRDAQVKPDVTDRCINIAFTRGGLDKLGLAHGLLDMFAGEFREGMAAAEHRQRILGDVGDSSRDRWQWGGTRNIAYLVARLGVPYSDLMWVIGLVELLGGLGILLGAFLPVSMHARNSSRLR